MSKTPLIMGIVNVTPDSFSDGGKFYDFEKAVAHGLQLLEEGADILDIGGESTRPGAPTIAVEDEIARVIPVIKELSMHGKPISIDTRNAVTMMAALQAGASIINDVTALQGKGSLEVAAQSQAKVCLMHMKGEPQTMQNAPVYKDVVEEVFLFLKKRIQVCIDAGIKHQNIMADVGIGFGKTAEHNLELIRNLDRFQDLNVPVLLGVSRKKFIEAVAGPAPASERLGGSLAVALWGYQKGVDILRVHDVHATRQALKVHHQLSS